MWNSREALNIVYQVADDFAAETAALCQTSVSDKERNAFLDAYAPVPEYKGQVRTMAENKRDALSKLWSRDNRVARGAGTAWGVNTYTHHKQDRSRCRAGRAHTWSVRLREGGHRSRSRSSPPCPDRPVSQVAGAAARFRYRRTAWCPT